MRQGTNFCRRIGIVHLWLPHWGRGRGPSLCGRGVGGRAVLNRWFYYMLNITVWQIATFWSLAKCSVVNDFRSENWIIAHWKRFRSIEKFVSTYELKDKIAACTLEQYDGGRKYKINCPIVDVHTGNVLYASGRGIMMSIIMLMCHHHVKYCYAWFSKYDCVYYISNNYYYN